MDNPPWSNRVVERFCSQIKKAVEKHDLPLPIIDEHCIIQSELGAGEYGAVVSTNKSDCVLKITSDETEAHFVATIMGWKKKFPGLVKYTAAFAVPATHKGNNVFLIWREKVEKVGLPETFSAEQKDLYAFTKSLIRAYKESDAAFRIATRELDIRQDESYWDWLDERVEMFDRGSPTRPLAARLLSFRAECAKMAETKSGELVGNAMGQLLHDGIILCDIHANNVGLCDRGWVITDPGHALVLKRSLVDVNLPLLK